MIKRCDCCSKIKTIVWTDSCCALQYYPKLCAECCLEFNLDFEKGFLLNCSECRDLFQPFKKESKCWACKNKLKLSKPFPKKEEIIIIPEKNKGVKLKCQMQLLNH